MDTDLRQICRKLEIHHEGMRLFPYIDSRGLDSIGAGRCIQRVGISAQEAIMLLDNDLDYHYARLADTFEWFEHLDPVRKAVLIDMSYNMGFKNLCEFTQTIDAISKGEFDRAAQDMLSSKWAQEVPTRAKEDAEMIRTGMSL